MKRLAVFVILLLTGVGLQVQDAQGTFHGDNGRIAFRRFFNADKTWGAVFTINPNGRHEVQVTNPPFGYVDRNPDVSPDGNQIVFEREANDCGPTCFVDDIYVVNADGSDLTRLTGVGSPHGTCRPTSGACNGSPAWSPDGKWITFSRASGPVVDDLVQRQAIYIMRADGSDVRRITQRHLPAPVRTPTPNGLRTEVRSCSSAAMCARPSRPMVLPSGLSTSELVTNGESRPTRSARATHPTGRRTGGTSSSTTTSTGPTCRQTSTRFVLTGITSSS